MYSLFIKLIFIGSLFHITPVALADDLDSQLGDKRFFGKFKEVIANADISTKLKLLDAEILDGVRVGLQYRYQNEPSYRDSFFTRIDRYQLFVNIEPGDLIGIEHEPFYLKMNRNTEIFVARQYKSRSQSLTAPPFPLTRLPTTAEKAIRYLKPGDFVAFSANMNFLVGLGGSMTSGYVATRGETHLLLSGEFMIHLFRLKDNRIRMKLIARRADSRHTSARVALNYDLEVVGIRFVDGVIEKYFNLNDEFLRLYKERQASDLFLADFIFDLNNPEAADSYNGVLSSQKTFANLKEMSKFLKKAHLHDSNIANLLAVERIFKEDRYLRPSERRVHRVFKGIDQAHLKKRGIKLGIALGQYQGDGIQADHLLSRINEQDEEERYRVRTYSTQHQQRLIFGLLKETHYRSLTALYPVDSESPLSNFPELALFRRTNDKFLNHSEFMKFYNFLKYNIPDSIFSEIPFGPWLEDRNKKRTAHLGFDLIFHHQAFSSIPSMTAEELKKAYLNYLKSRADLTDSPQQVYKDSRDFLFQLGILLSRSIGPEDKSLAIMQLRKNKLFYKVGVGFIISLIPEETLQQAITLEVDVSAAQLESLKYRYGYFQNRDIYYSVIYLENILNNRSIDMRPNEDEDFEYDPAVADRP